MLALKISFVLAITSHLTCAQYFITRAATGDVLTGPNELDCTLHNAQRINTNTCNCGPRSTYYTDQNNRTQCFKGSGAAELGCDTFVRGDTPKDVITRSLTGQFETMYLDYKDYFCTLEFQSISYWVNDTWEKFPLNNYNFDAASKTDQPDEHDYSKIWKGISWLPFDAAKKEIYAGQLIRFNWKACEKMSCIMFKFPGKEPC